MGDPMSDRLWDESDEAERIKRIDEYLAANTSGLTDTIGSSGTALTEEPLTSFNPKRQDYYALFEGTEYECQTTELISDRLKVLAKTKYNNPEIGFNYGNAIKYLMRWHSKGDPIKDIDKCIEYLERIKENINDRL